MFQSILFSGTPFSQFTSYQLNIVDFIYIRTKFRRQRLASETIEYIFKLYETPQDIGFSYPMSDALRHGEWI